ncbi:MAG: UvrD-helicase domain-containing protein, partial [Propionibacteriaceae bacterium]|nr:UvrD-helicase domain-containing protein [Propionibacteriaceae bacterium]
LVNEPLVDRAADAAGLRVVVKGEVLILGPDRLAEIRNDVLRHHKLNQARGAAEQALLAALWDLRPAELDLERDEFDDLVTDQAAYRMFLQAWWPSLSPVQVLARLADPRLAVRLAEGVLAARDAERLAESYAEYADWSVADVALLDELAAILGPVVVEAEPDPLLFLADGADVSEVVTTADRTAQRRESDPFAEVHDTYAHVLVDEAQDITPLQWLMLRRRGAQASWTIVGDPAQSSWPDAEESANVLNELIGRAPHRNFRMSTNYRSPAEVFELAAQVVSAVNPNADLPRAVRHTDIEPLLLAVRPDDLDAALVERVAELADHVAGTIGVICPPSRIAHASQVLGHSALAGLADRIGVVTPLEAKGLEYDAVIVISPDEIVTESPGGIRVLYVALTRPTQRLVTLDVTPSGTRGEWRRVLD